jgi:hypothetical protein
MLVTDLLGASEAWGVFHISGLKGPSRGRFSPATRLTRKVEPHPEAWGSLLRFASRPGRWYNQYTATARIGSRATDGCHPIAFLLDLALQQERVAVY